MPCGGASYEVLRPSIWGGGGSTKGLAKLGKSFTAHLISSCKVESDAPFNGGGADWCYSHLSYVGQHPIGGD